MWEGTVDVAAADLLRPATNPDERSEHDEAVTWLADYLAAEGSAAAGDVRRHAAAAGLAWRALQRARRTLGVVTQRRGFGRGATYVWSLPDSPCVPHGAHACHACQAPEVGTHGTHGGTPTDDDPATLLAGFTQCDDDDLPESAS